MVIFTTDKPSSATLNFCGISENPDEREDSKVHLKFEENSIMVLNFPHYTHHKFCGEFVCVSIHPNEGLNLIEALQSGNLSAGFLKTATIFSKTNQQNGD